MVIEAFEQFVCRLPAKGYGTTEFDMSDARRNALMAGGQAAMARYCAEMGFQSLTGADMVALEQAWVQADEIALGLLQP
jgi:hypothetical protein